jgi:hypothetical protein
MPQLFDDIERIRYFKGTVFKSMPRNSVNVIHRYMPSYLLSVTVSYGNRSLPACYVRVNLFGAFILGMQLSDTDMFVLLETCIFF